MDQQLTAPGLGDSAPRSTSLTYDGTGGQIGKIALTNGLLGLVTLGVYRFWGKTRLRRYLWSHVILEGDRLEYTGRGLELFLGFLFVSLFLVLLYGAIFVAALALGFGFAELQGIELLLVFLILPLIPIAIYRARRYRLSRTYWRGIRAGQTGSAIKYALMTIGLFLLSIITAGLAHPYNRTVLQRYRTQNTWFGDQRFEFEASAWKLFGKWLLTLLLYPFTFGFSYFWYRIVEFRYYAGCTRFMGAEFSSRLDTGRVIGIVILTYIATIVFSFIVFALAAAVAFVFMPDLVQDFGQTAADPNLEPSPALIAAYLVVGLIAALGFGVIQTVFFIQPLVAEGIRSLSIEGDIDFETLAQSAERGPRHGEGLADALDLSPI